jgi:hypothetical protein
VSIRFPKVQYDVVELRGGWDQVTPTLSLKAGVVRDVLNFEVAPTGGYARVGGYERYDGHAKPSVALVTYVQVTSFTNVPSVGQTLTGQTTGTTGVIVAVNTTSNYMVLTKIAVSSYNGSEEVRVGATSIGTQTTLTATITAKQTAQYLDDAADVYRALISAVPGSGAVRGVFGLTVSGTDKVFAFRNNAGGTGMDLYVASASGWTQVAYKREVSFTAGGTATPADGATLTQGAVTAVVRRVMASSGVWTGTAAGRFVIDTPAGGAGVFAAGAATLTGGATVTISGADTAITVLPDGHVETSEGNFTGSSSTIRIYGCDGVNRAFEFDGTTYAPIASGATTDTPKHLAVHKNALVLAISSSIIISGPGVPYRYQTIDGGLELACGDVVTGFLIMPGEQTTGGLAVFALSTTFMLYGTGLVDWNLTHYNTGTGAVHYTAQNLAQSYALGTQGLISLATTLAYGNFTQATLTSQIKTFIVAQRNKAIASTVCRDKSQYRVFFTDGYALYVTIVNGRALGCMPALFLTPVFCAWEGTSGSGDEIMYVGDTAGYVQQMDVGTSYDGGTIDAYITLNWNPMGSSRMLKRYRHASVEMQGNFYAEINYSYQLGYATGELDQPTGVAYPSGFQGAPAWDTFTWDSFIWDGRTLFPTEVDVRGTGENMQITISCTGSYIAPFTINSIINHYTPRRGLR